MKTAGVVVDFYDDPSGHLLKGMFSTPDELPDQVKTAHILSTEELNVLRDEAYALIMVNDGNVLRKFACVDPGNTILSMSYFEKTASSLPEEAVAVAAEGLLSFCKTYGLEPTNFVKMSAAMHRGSASGMSRTRDPMKAPYVGDEVDWASRTNLVSMRGGGDQGRVIPMAAAMKTAEVLGSSVVLTDDKRHIGTDTKSPEIQNHKAMKEPVHGKGTEPKVNYPRIVNVSGKDAPIKFEKKSSTRYALGSKYPLDNYADVKKAVSYFNENYLEMDPDDRHEYCVKTASRAEELGIPVSDIMARYGSTEYAPDIEAHIVSRQSICDDEWKGVYAELLEKKASVTPDDFVLMLNKVDQKSGLERQWGGHISDPWMATFGGATEKQKTAGWSWKSPTGDMVNAEALNRLARNGQETLRRQFSEGMAAAFSNDPIVVFDSLPLTTKQILCNMANSFR